MRIDKTRNAAGGETRRQRKIWGQKRQKRQKRNKKKKKQKANKKKAKKVKSDFGFAEKKDEKKSL